MNYSKYLLLSILLALVSVNAASAQDFTFSQYFNSPLSMNPANTGYYRQDFRAGVIHRRQWQQIGNPYITSGVFADFNFKPGSFLGVPKPGAPQIGVGLLLIDDQIGNGVYRARHAVLSTSYIMQLGEFYRHKLAFGAQLGIYQKQIDINNLLFATQFDRFFQLDPNIPSRETFGERTQSNLNVNVGANYSLLLNKKTYFYAGASVFNITAPTEPFLIGLSTSSQPRQPRRFFLTSSIQRQIGPRLTISPMAMLQLQEGAREFTIGANFATQLNSLTNNNGFKNPEEVILYFGAFYRTSDAIIPYAGLRYKNFTGGVSYDINLSSLSASENGANPPARPRVTTLEFSLSYAGFWDRKTPNRISVPCKDYY